MREVIAGLERAGWTRVRQKGSHVQFKHPQEPGRLATVPYSNVEEHRKAVGPEIEVSRRQYYVGVVHKDADSDYGVSFPDFPRAMTAAQSLDAALVMAEEALALHVEGMLAEGESIPPPSSPGELLRTKPEYRGSKLILVPLKTDVSVP